MTVVAPAGARTGMVGVVAYGVQGVSLAERARAPRRRIVARA